ncbi:hypothetical protein U1Q18_050469 [Sarracenia purpurea var. burkii]
MTINRKSVKLIRSDYADIMIKVATDVYHLDRFQLALKSEYFEKLFIDDFHEKKCDLIELPAMDSDIFSAVVDVIYGKYLGSVITVENCVSLLMAMDYLQMRIDLRVYARFIEKNTGIELLSDSIIFQLYDFISQNQNFKILLPPVFKYLSSHLMDVRGYEEFLSLPLEHFIEIILAGHLPEDMKCIREFSEICVEWISYDWENRLPHIIKLVNAAKCILQSPYCIKDDNLRINLDNLSQEMKQEKVSRYFQRLLYYKGEINIAPEKSKITSNKGFYDGSHDKIMRNKLARFLENGNFYDITVEVEGKTYKLNRFKLKSMCGYFAKLFSAESTAEISAEPEKSLKTSIHSNKDEAYSLDEIDHTAFELIIDYMYLNELGLTSNTIIKVLKADSILQIKGLQCKCESWMMNHIGKINTDLAAEIMNFTRGNVRFEDFHKLYFRKVVPATWPEMADNVSLFSSVSFDMLEEILLSETLPSFANPKSTPDFCIDDQHKLLDICSKWIIHDLKNRFHLIPRIALAINCNYMVDYDDYKVETPADFINWSQRDVRDELWKILCSTLKLFRINTRGRIASCGQLSTTMDNDKNSENLIRSDYADIMVKVDTDVYHLDRLQLALKSDYFEKLFIDDFYEKKCDLIELPVIDSDTFSAVVDMIYGKELKSVLTTENCVSLLMAMDYLQMRIDLKAYASFINDKSKNDLLSDAIILELFNFILENQNFKDLLPPVLKYLSSHWSDIRGYQEFFSVPFEHFIEIILPGHLSEEMKVISDFSKICVEWICYDWENRHTHIMKLVNAAKRKLKSPDYIKEEKLDINLHNMSEEMKQEKVLKYFKRLLHYKGEINIGR